MAMELFEFLKDYLKRIIVLDRFLDFRSTKFSSKYLQLNFILYTLSSGSVTLSGGP